MADNLNKVMEELQLAKILGRLIEKRKMSLRDLAKETGVPQATLSSYLSGGRSGKPEHVLALSRFFGCSMEFLLFGHDERKPTLEEVLTEPVFEGWLKVKIEKAVPNRRRGDDD